MEAGHNKIDWFMLGALLLLMVVGNLLVYTATIGEPGMYWQKQMIYFILGALLISMMYFIPSKFFQIMAYPFYGLSLLPLLYVTLMKADSVERWIPMPGGFKFQPSEFAKFSLLLALSHYLSSHKVSINNFKSLIPVGAFMAFPFVLVLKQPDLSTALVFSVMVIAMLYWSGMRAWEIFILLSPLFSVLLTSFHFLWGLLFVVLIAIMWLYRVNLIMFLSTIIGNMAAGYCSILLWNKILKEHQRDRILTFIDPMRDPQGSGYQIIQSKVATGSGGFFGKGFGQGTQTNLSFLPEEHTDFIFSVLGEQFGFVGASLVILLYFFIIYRIFRMTVTSRNPFANLAIVGVGAIFSFHVFINIAMTLGMMPVTGLPLPFLSYGGSFVLTSMIFIGLVLNLKTKFNDF